jgi:hypothetical protein
VNDREGGAVRFGEPRTPERNAHGNNNAQLGAATGNQQPATSAQRPAPSVYVAAGDCVYHIVTHHTTAATALPAIRSRAPKHRAAARHGAPSGYERRGRLQPGSYNRVLERQRQWHGRDAEIVAVSMVLLKAGGGRACSGMCVAVAEHSIDQRA